MITEVFPDYQGPGGGSAPDDGKEWIEVYNASGRALDLTGLVVTHARPDGSRRAAIALGAVAIDAGGYLALGSAAPSALPPYLGYGYGDALGDLFNTGGGKLALQCGDREVDAATYEAVLPGRSRQLSAGQSPNYTANDEAERWCDAATTEFEPQSYGTPGQDNDCTAVVVGQCTDRGQPRPVVSPRPGELVITEIMPSPTATADATGEWLEVRALADVDLNGVALDRVGDAAPPERLDSPDCLRLSAGEHAVLARSADPARNGGLDPRGTFRLSLVGGSAAAPGDVRLLSGDTAIDAVAWTSSRAGRALALTPAATSDSANDDPANFCDATTPYVAVGSVIDYGTPGAPNRPCAAQPPVGQCFDAAGGARPIRKPAGGALVITELLANPAGTGTDAAQEWFEITNAGSAPFDLNGLGLKGNASTINAITAPDCRTLSPGAFALFARVPDPAQNGGLPRPDATFSFALAQSQGSITVLDGAETVDTVRWTTGIVDGAAKALRRDRTSAAANDDPASFCDATEPYGTAGNLGTPREPNPCP